MKEDIIRIFCAIIPLSLFIVLNAQEQLGSDIDGEAVGDFSRFSVSLDSDGDRVAIGAYQNAGSNAGHARIYS